MKKKSLFIVLIVATVLIAGYALYRNRYTQQVVFFVSNESRYDLPLVELEIRIDGKPIVHDTFRTSRVVPDYTSYVKKIKKGVRSIEAYSKGKIRAKAKKEIEVSDKPLYIFVSFDYDTLTGKEIDTQRMIFYMLHDSTVTKFKPDSLVRRKDISIHVMDEKPVHM